MLVIGATSLIGRFLLPALVETGYTVIASSRRRREQLDGPVRWHRLEGVNPLRELPRPLSAAISLAPLQMLPSVVDQLAALTTRRLIAFSSTSLFTKANSTDARERQLAIELLNAEEELARRCERHNIAWTVFRPTLVYGFGMDRNVSEIAWLVRRLRVFPLIGEARGRRQPVHAADLAAACVAALDNPRTHNQAYNLSGGRTLSYRDMVEEVFRGVGLKPRFVRVPVWVVQRGIAALRILPRFSQLSPELATRMNTDMCFDSRAATRDFGFNPRPFWFSDAGGEGTDCFAAE